MERSTPVVAFICTHNACRSQIAEAVARTWAKDAFIPCSAGTNPVASVNDDALRILRDRYGIDASQQRPKTLAELPTVDFVVTMGCGVACPALPARHREDWGLEDPTGKGDAAFLATIDTIIERMLDVRGAHRDRHHRGQPRARAPQGGAPPQSACGPHAPARYAAPRAARGALRMQTASASWHRPADALASHAPPLRGGPRHPPARTDAGCITRLSRCALDTVRETLNLRPENPC